jgi:photosystem II stability/assembly factor-like uncharacterized protein
MTLQRGAGIAAPLAMSPAGCAILAACLLLAASVSAEEPSAWRPLTAPDACDATLHGVCFADDAKGWVVGDKGLCLATKDGGQTWVRQETGSRATLRCVRFLDASSGFACGDGYPPAPAPKERVATDRPLICSTLLSTADGGKSWKASWIDTNRAAYCVEALAMSGPRVGTGWREGEVLWTEGDGARWQGTRCYREILSLRALDGKRWLAVGSSVSLSYYPVPADPAYTSRACRALFSDDDGKTWNVSKGADDRGFLRGLAVRKGAPAVAVGNQGNILVSADAGENWKAVESGTQSDLRSAAWSPSMPMVVAVGKDGAVTFSNDGAKTWKAIPVGAVSLNSVAAAGDSFVAIGDKGTLLRAEAKDLK